MAKKSHRNRLPDTVGDITHRAPVPLASLSLRGNLVYANEAFARAFGCNAGALRRVAIASVLPEEVAEAMRQPGEEREWKDASSYRFRATSFDVKNGVGIMIRPVDEPAAADAGVLRVLAEFDLIEREMRGAAVSAVVARLRSALLSLPPAAEVIDIASVLDAAVSDRHSRLSEAGVSITRPAQPAGRVSAAPSRALIGDVLDQALSELRLRALPRVLRVAVLAEASSVSVRLTHNGSHRPSQRLMLDALRWGVRLNVASPGPGLGVTYTLIFGAPSDASK